jgi:hypothetical protein
LKGIAMTKTSRLAGIFVASSLSGGFGLIAAAPADSSVLFSDSFESGNLSHAENGVSWNSPEKVTVGTGNAKSGKYSAKFHFPGSSDLTADSWAELRFALPSMRTEIWIKYDLFIPSNYYHRSASGASNNKGLIMLWGGDYGRMTTQSAVSFWPSMGSAKGASMMCADVKTNGGESTHYCQQSNLLDKGVTSATETIVFGPADAGRWRNFVIHYKLADVGVNNGVLEVWKDGTKLWSARNVPNYASSTSGNGFNNGYILGWSNSGFNQDTDFYLDNVVFATSPSDLDMVQPDSPSGLVVN